MILAAILGLAMIQPSQATTKAHVNMFAEVAEGITAPQDPLEDRIKALHEAREKKDILAWMKAAMPKTYHRGFCTELHGYFVSIRHDPLTCTEAPRDHAKTAIKCVGIPLYQALEEPELYDYYLNLQGTEKKALAVNLAIKLELEQNEALRAVYGDQIGLDKWTDQLFVLKNNVAFQAASTGQAIRGTMYRMRRPNYAILDDIYDDNDINNPESTQKKTEWVWSTLYPMLAEDRASSLHVQGTAINDVDILKELSTKPGVKYRSFAAMDEVKKTVLWPELKTYAQREAQRAIMPAVIFAREYQNERRDDSSSIVKPSWLTTWEYDPVDLKLNRATHKLMATLLTIDPSIGKKEEGDPAAYALVLKTIRDDGSLPEYYIEGITNRVMSLKERLDEVDDYVQSRPKERPLTLVRVEAISGFDDFCTMVTARVPVPCEAIAHVTDKITHLERKSHYFQNKRIFLNRNIDPETKREVVYQLTVNHPKHDDIRDAILHALDDEAADNWETWV